jgi:hypothetical protein
MRNRSILTPDGVEILVVFLHVLGVVLHRLPFVHCVEVKLGVFVLDRLEVHTHGLLDAVAVFGSALRPSLILHRQ